MYDASGSLVYVVQQAPGTENDFVTSYVKMDGQTIARVKSTGPFSSYSDEITYLHHDHLGSAVAGTDQNGDVLWTEKYTPYGIALVNDAANDNQAGFTGHIKDTDTGLTYMQARYYDPVIGRFLSIDPVTFNGQNNPAFFNRYTYAFNNPVNIVDPTGRCGESTARDGCKITQRNVGENDTRRDTSKKLIKSSIGLIINSLGGKQKDAQFDISSKPGSIKGAGARIQRSANGGDAGSISKAIRIAAATNDPQFVDTTLGGLQTGVVGVGEANFIMQGNVSVEGDEWTFTGTITGTGESFDFNSKSSGQRAAGSEGATRIGGGMERAGIASSYQVDYLGGFDVVATGTVPPELLPEP